MKLTPPTDDLQPGKTDRNIPSISSSYKNILALTVNEHPDINCWTRQELW